MRRIPRRKQSVWTVNVTFQLRSGNAIPDLILKLGPRNCSSDEAEEMESLKIMLQSQTEDEHLSFALSRTIRSTSIEKRLIVTAF